MYIISVEYGMWEDAVAHEIFVTVDPTRAMEAFDAIQTRVKAIMTTLRDAYVYNGEMPYTVLRGSSDPLENILARLHFDDVELVMYFLPDNVLFSDGRQRLKAAVLELLPYPEQMVLPEVDDRDPMTRFEALALPYERRLHGWRIH